MFLSHAVEMDQYGNLHLLLLNGQRLIIGPATWNLLRQLRRFQNQSAGSYWGFCCGVLGILPFLPVAVRSQLLVSPVLGPPVTVFGLLQYFGLAEIW